MEERFKALFNCNKVSDQFSCFHALAWCATVASRRSLWSTCSHGRPDNTIARRNC